MDRMFRVSDLFRPKWDDQRGSETYGERTISKALEGITEFYTGHSNGHKPWRDRRGHLHLSRIEVEL